MEDFLLILHLYMIAAAEQCRKDLGTCKVLSQRVVKRFAKVCLSSEQKAEKWLPIDVMVYIYSTDLLTFCLLWYGFHDTTHEVDGDRLLQYWKFLTVIFQQEGYCNYAKEGLTLAIQSQVISERKVTELNGAGLSMFLVAVVTTFHVTYTRNI